MSKTYILGCLLCALVTHQVYGQLSNDSLRYQAAIRATTHQSSQLIGINSLLYNGYDYSRYSPLITGSAYLTDSLHFEHGSVNYEGIVYHDVPLVYDVYKDILVSNLRNPILPYSLVTERVNGFQISGRHFIRIVNDTATLKTGFYEAVYDIKLRVLVRREKSIQTQTDAAKTSFFDDRVSYFLYKDRQYYPVNGAADIIRILKNKKEELNRYVDGNHIRFGPDPIPAMVLIAAFYDKLPN